MLISKAAYHTPATFVVKRSFFKKKAAFQLADVAGVALSADAHLTAPSFVCQLAFYSVRQNILLVSRAFTRAAVVVMTRVRLVNYT